ENRAAAWLGVAVSLLGAAVAAGFFGHVTALMRIQSGRDASMSLAAAVCLILAGVSLLLAADGRRGRGWSTGLAWALAGLSAVALAESLLDMNFGLDLVRQYAWLQDPALRPGRMAPNSALGFLLIAVVLLALPRVNTRRAGRLLRWLTLAAALIAVSGLAGYFVHIEALISYHGMPAMALYSAGGMLALAIGAWLLWRERRWNRPPGGRAPSTQVVATAAALLVVVVAASGISSFVLLWHSTERGATTDLSLRRDQRIRYVLELVAAGNAAGHHFAERAGANWPAQPRVGARALGRFPPGLASGEFVSAALMDLHGRVIGRQGEQVVPEMALPITSSASLLWNNGFYLRQKLEIIRGGRLLGTAVVERPEPLLRSIGVETASWGETGEMGLCGPSRRQLHTLACFPQRLRPQTFTVSFQVNGVERPMALAVEGYTGVMQSPDYRGRRTLAAYAPVPGLGLGLVMKMDTVELFASNRRQLEIMIPILALLVVIGLELLRWQVRPLLRELVASRNQAQASEARFRAAAESGMEPFYIFESVRDPVQGAVIDFRLVYANHPGELIADLEKRHQPGMGLSAIPQLAQASRFLEKFSRVVA
ncbi:MAG: hypothetical protein ACRD1E_04985, partial [Terriglobales bacterium]